jgi:hypothetical protein
MLLTHRPDIFAPLATMDQQTFDKVLMSEVLPSIRDGLSKMGKDFLTKCLQLDPANRITADEALKHPWLKGNLKDRAAIKQAAALVRAQWVPREEVSAMIEDIPDLEREAMPELSHFFSNTLQLDAEQDDKTIEEQSAPTGGGMAVKNGASGYKVTPGKKVPPTKKIGSVNRNSGGVKKTYKRRHKAAPGRFLMVQDKQAQQLHLPDGSAGQYNGIERHFSHTALQQPSTTASKTLQGSRTEPVFDLVLETLPGEGLSKGQNGEVPSGPENIPAMRLDINPGPKKVEKAVGQKQVDQSRGYDEKKLAATKKWLDMPAQIDLASHQSAKATAEKRKDCSTVTPFTPIRPVDDMTDVALPRGQRYHQDRKGKRRVISMMKAQ